MLFGNRNIYFRESFQFSIVTIKKYHLSGNPKSDYLGVFQTLKLLILLRKILSVTFKLNFTPNTLGCYGLNKKVRFPLVLSSHQKQV